MIRLNGIISRLNEMFVVLISVPNFFFKFLFYKILERKDDKLFKRHICYFNFHSILYRLNDLLYCLNDRISRLHKKFVV